MATNDAFQMHGLSQWTVEETQHAQFQQSIQQFLLTALIVRRLDTLGSFCQHRHHVISDAAQMVRDGDPRNTGRKPPGSQTAYMKIGWVRKGT
jgi:hypothetical protein